MKPKTIVPVIVEKRPRCPGCKRELAGWSVTDKALPSKGDFSVCDRCFCVGCFTGRGFELRAATAEEIEAAIAAGEVGPESGDFLRTAFAAHAARKRGSV